MSNDARAKLKGMSDAELLKLERQITRYNPRSSVSGAFDPMARPVDRNARSVTVFNQRKNPRKK